jgi:tetratricopeptide (TPR) repeat protein
MGKVFVKGMFVLLVCGLALSAGCSSVDFREPGTIIDAPDEVKEKAAMAANKFNEATALLAVSFDKNTDKFDMEKVDKAVVLYKEAETLDPNDPKTQKQLGWIYKYVLEDEKTALKYYKKFQELGGAEPVLIDLIRDLEEKYPPTEPAKEKKEEKTEPPEPAKEKKVEKSEPPTPSTPAKDKGDKKTETEKKSESK